MSIFIDTSGLLAVLDRDEINHAVSAAAWSEILQSDETLVTTNYVLVETCALLQHRLGLAAVRLFDEDIAPILDIIWVDGQLHHAAMGILLATGRKRLSLVDCVSFEAMRGRRLTRAFALDRHFREQGFDCLPER